MKPRPATSVNTGHALYTPGAFDLNEGSGTTTACLGDASVVGTFAGATPPTWGVDRSGRYVLLNSAVTTSDAGRIVVPTNPLIQSTKTPATAFSIEVVYDNLLGTFDSYNAVLLEKRGDYGLHFGNGNFIIYWWPDGSSTASGTAWIAKPRAGRVHLYVHVAADGTLSLVLNGTTYTPTFTNTKADWGAQTHANPLVIGSAADGTKGSAVNLRALRIRNQSILSADDIAYAQADPYAQYDRELSDHWVPYVTNVRWPTNHTRTINDTGGVPVNVHTGRIALFEAADVKMVHTGSGGREANAPDGFQIAAALQMDVIRQTTWEGATSASVAPGALVSSDVHRRAGGELFVHAERTLVKTREMFSGPGNVPSQGYVTGPYWSGSTIRNLWGGADLMLMGNVPHSDGYTVTAADLTLSGTVPQNNYFPPASLLLLGRRTSNLNSPVVVVAGDSIGNGQGGDGGLGNTIGGYPARAAARLHLSVINLSVASETLRDWRLNHSRRTGVLDLIDQSIRIIFLWQLGVNDLAGVGQTYAQFKANLIAAIAERRAAHPNCEHYWCVPAATVDSTDSYATEANQTTRAWVANHRVPMLADLRANWASWGLDGFIEAHQGVESAYDSGKVKSNGTANWAMADGTHFQEPAVRTAEQIVESLLRERIKLTCSPSVTGTTDTTISLKANHYGGQLWNDFAWTCTDKPAGSTATFDDAASDAPAVTIDQPGTYVFEVTVSDPYTGEAVTGAVTVRVPPTADAVVSGLDRGDGTPGNYLQTTANHISLGTVVGAGAYQVTGAAVLTADDVQAALNGGGDYLLDHNGGTGTDGALITVNGEDSEADILRYTSDGTTGIDDVEVRAYLKSDYDNGLRKAVGSTMTGTDGRWVSPIELDSGTYYVIAGKQGPGGFESRVVTVVIP